MQVIRLIPLLVIIPCTVGEDADSCSTADVANVGRGPALFNNLNTCVTTTGGFNDGALECVSASTNISKSCATCYFELYSCAATACQQACLQQFSADCVGCSMGICGDELQICTGTPGAVLPDPFTTSDLVLPTPAPNGSAANRVPRGLYVLPNSDEVHVSVNIDNITSTIDTVIRINTDSPLIPQIDSQCADMPYTFDSNDSTIIVDFAEAICLKNVYDELRAVAPALPVGLLTIQYNKVANTLSLPLLSLFVLEKDSNATNPIPPSNSSTTIPPLGAENPNSSASTDAIRLLSICLLLVLLSF
ncbi:hypothetical protein Pmar_PMAR006418 [Perkinsus marinus ATCC 50983]|uniref:Uncharacterized protein n=1 Tax=Perkinsus marinus (strain ATCC 50983 / TXsc) TaxID=423536 RepID=C5K9M6_PERM5|nr:hypothetical protein Pmar_PMAR006418 [Perkinsus marinus ATCC 50983]EER18798.1 hypothetical protein Pmar_PMAR006418 [Perkinsus marinus ATCC 50983]|eukprot:XP_002787002.1 hypothetical protein Pmar_PMAR006418 [Perkinsus marinus ATCC 50983]